MLINLQFQAVHVMHIAAEVFSELSGFIAKYRREK
jgi:hypothetical protein